MTISAAVPDVASRLAAIVGPSHCLTGEAAVPFATDVYRSLEMPLAVARPESVGEVQAIVRLAAEQGWRLSIRGGGASYTDGYLPNGASHLLLDLGRLNKIVEINEYDGYVTVEAGTTWASLKAALDARDLRTPFWGPFSGLVATVGGSVSQHSISHGSGTHGITARSVQAVEIVTADGSLLKTGSAMTGGAPFARHFGPDLTGLFAGDCGIFGIKVRLTLPLLRRRAAHRPISFAFPTFEAMHEGMRRVGLERLEDTQFALDAALSQGQIARQDGMNQNLALAVSILKSSPSLLAGLRQLAISAVAARKSLTRSAYMVHYIVEGVDDAETRGRLQRIRTLLHTLGREIPPTVPAVVRGMPFAPLFNTLGPSGERWVPVHGILAHSAAVAFHHALEAFYAERAAVMKALGIWTGSMFATVDSSGFLYEIAIYWPDERSAYHEANIPADYLEKLPAYPPNPAARDYVRRLKEDLIALYVAHGAINFQLGKAYPFASRLESAPHRLVDAIKACLDPDKLLSPGALA